MFGQIFGQCLNDKEYQRFIRPHAKKKVIHTHTHRNTHTETHTHAHHQTHYFSTHGFSEGARFEEPFADDDEEACSSLSMFASVKRG